VLTYSVGYAGSGAGAKAMAQYLLASTLDQKLSAAARYYGGEMPPTPTLLEDVAQRLNRGEIDFDEAVAELVTVERLSAAPAAGPSLHFGAGHSSGFDIEAAEARATAQLLEAVTRADFAESAAPSTGKLRPDLSPAFAKTLGIDPSLPLTEDGIANLLNLRRLDGGEIEGKRINQPMRTLVDVFGLDPAEPPTGQALANVLAGKRVDGDTPRALAGNGAPLPDKIVAGALKRFHAALGVQPGKEPSPEQLENILAGKSAKGFAINAADYQHKIHATKSPLGFVDFTFSSDKTLGVAFALAPTEVERAAILGIHERANADAMAFMEKNIGFATMGANGKDGVEPATMAWVSFQHFTSRPTVDISMTDKAGVDYTERREVPDPNVKPDPNIHSHNAVLASVMTQSGRVASLDLGLLDGLVLQAGAVYQARVAYHANQLGIEVVAGPSGEARFAAIPDAVRDLFSKRTAEATAAARDLAAKKGLVWDDLNGPQQVAMLKAGSGLTRNAKHNPATVGESVGDLDGWAKQAADIGYKHESLLRPDAIKPPIEPALRQGMAYENSLDPLDHKLTGTTTLDERELRVQAARGFINAGGISADPMADMDAVMDLYRKHGVKQDGVLTSLEWGRDVPVRGKDVTSVTTSLHADQERELVGLMRSAAADKSGVLSEAQLDHAAVAFLQRNPDIDPNGPQWKAQREMMTKLASAGRYTVAIGSAGSGKSTIVSPLYDAWTVDGRIVYGAALANRQASDLAAAGIPAERRSSVAAFIRRGEHGKYKLDSNSVVVIDEVSLLSTRDQLSLLRLQKQHGFTLAEVGDFAQMQSIEASGGLALVRRALPDIPEILTSVRQNSELERENVRLVRAGEVGEVLDRKQADGTLLMVAGGREKTVERTAQLWHDRMLANQGDARFTLSVSTVSNQDVLEIGAAIRSKRRQAGEIGADVVTKSAVDNSNQPYKLPLAVGDKVRLFDRVYDAAKPGRDKVLANNGSIVEIVDLTTKGMVIKNAADEIGTVRWSALQKRASDPIRLTYGYAMTRNLAQGITSSEHIDAPLDGTRSTNIFSAYVAMSRHKQKSWVVLNEGAIRQSISSKWVDGHAEPLRPADVLRRAAEDMSRRPERGSALEMLDRITGQQRGTLVGFQRTMEPVERQARTPGLSQFREFQLAISPAMRYAADIARDLSQRVTQQVQRVVQRPDRGPSLGL
jgi:hypothetical protein